MTPHSPNNRPQKSPHKWRRSSANLTPRRPSWPDLGLKHWETCHANYLAPLMAMGVLERTIPDKPRRRMQRYRTTEAGPAVLKDKASGQSPGQSGDGHV